MAGRIPNLFIIGAMKSGTTSLHEYLSNHEDVFMSEVKEPGYFSDCVDYYPKDEAWYMALFEQAKDEVYVGESSTHYSKLPNCDGVARKIKLFNPDSKFIYLMRNPVNRAISHYWHNVKKMRESRGILEAIKENPEYVDYGDYALQLMPYIEEFGKERIYTTTYEEFFSDPGRELSRLLGWLGLPEDGVQINSYEEYNRLPESFTKLRGKGRLYRIRESRFWELVSPYVPKAIRRKAAGYTESEARKDKSLESDVVDYLGPVFRDRIKNLENLLERDFDVWN